MNGISPRLLKRLLSALLLAPIALILMVAHPASFLIVVVPCFLLAVYEWIGIVRAVPRRKLGIALIGALYIPICFYAFTVLRLSGDIEGGHQSGAFLVFFLLLAVWASDTGAYVVGKGVGGAKWVPSISPNKTWAGLGGAMIFPGLLMILPAFILGYYAGNEIFWLVLLFITFGLLLGLVCQIGDLFISVFKRRAGLKDTGNLIPGHGGILDRIDSLMAASLFLYLVLKLITHLNFFID